jgi:hypothetical protein
MVLRPTFACLIAALLALPVAASAGDGATGPARCSTGLASVSIAPSPQIPGQSVTVTSTYTYPYIETFSAYLCYVKAKAVHLSASGGTTDTTVLQTTSGLHGAFLLRSDICDLTAEHGTIVVVLAGQKEGPLGQAALNPVCLSLKKMPAATPTPGGAPHPL